MLLGTSYEIAFHNDGDEPVCFAPVIDGKNMHWSYRVPEHATHVLSGHLDGDKIFPFQFATTPLASTSADVSNNQSLGSIKFIAKNIIKTEPTTISTTIPEHKKVNLNDSFAKKTTSIGTQLGEPQLQKLASITRTCCSGNTILAKVECQVKSPLAMLSEKILSPAWKHWWDYEQQAYGTYSCFMHILIVLGMNNLEWVDPSFSSGLTTKSLENEKNSFLIGYVQFALLTNINNCRPATEAPNTAKFNKVLSKIGLMVNYGPKALLEVLASLICGKSKTDAVIGYLTQQVCTISVWCLLIYSSCLRFFICRNTPHYI